jgi:hypothetical protein
MSGENTRSANGGRFKVTTSGWPTERWVAVIALSALVFLILVRRGFRSVNLLGVNVGVK